MTTGQSSPTPPKEPVYISALGGGLTYEHSHEREGQDIGLHIYMRDKASLFFQYEHSLGTSGLIFAGSTLTSLSHTQQMTLGANIGKSDVYTQLNSLSQSLTAELRKDQASFALKYGRQWEQGVFADQTLGLQGLYINKAWTFGASLQAGGKDLHVQQANFNAGYNKDKTTFLSSLCYDAASKSFMPKFTITSKF